MSELTAKRIKELRAQIKDIVDLKYYRKWAKQHPNFITPHIISLRNVGTYVIELSEGTDFDRKPIYGVTTLKLSGSTFNNMPQIDGLNKMFYSKTEALAWINNKSIPFAVLNSIIPGNNGCPCLSCGIERDKCQALNQSCLLFKRYLTDKLGITWSA